MTVCLGPVRVNRGNSGLDGLPQMSEIDDMSRYL
jgi:hypothetical protein